MHLSRAPLLFHRLKPVAKSRWQKWKFGTETKFQTVKRNGLRGFEFRLRPEFPLLPPAAKGVSPRARLKITGDAILGLLLPSFGEWAPLRIIREARLLRSQQRQEDGVGGAVVSHSTP